jgi:hypothetical protein
MGKLARAIAGVVGSVCGTMLGLDPEVGGPGAPPDGPAGCVRFTGAWSGYLVLRCDPGFARACAAILLEDDACGDDAICDALGELTSMVAGNLKAVLPAPTQLSLPCVVSGGLHGADAIAIAPAPAPRTEVAHVHFQLPPEHRLAIEVWQDAAPPHANPPDRGRPADIPG